MLTRVSVLLCVVVIAVACGTAVGSVQWTPTDESGDRVSLDLRDASLGEALKAIFHGTSFSYAFDEPGLEALRVTISMHDVTWLQAFGAILEMHGLKYTKSGDVYYIVRSWPEPQHLRESSHGPIIIYSRELPDEEVTQVVWRAFSSDRGYRAPSDEHVLYTVRGLDRTQPIELGLLPAPDGSCLLVWQVKGALPGSQSTRWVAIRLVDGAITELGETPGLPWISQFSPLPYWDYWDHHYRLVMVPDSCVFTPDLGTLSGAVRSPATSVPDTSSPGPLSGYEDRLTAYCEQHHQAEAEHLRSAFAKLASEMEVGHLGFEDPAKHPYLLLRCLGIPSVRNLGREGWSIPTIHAACSPDGTIIAYADRWRHEGLPSPEGRLSDHYGWGARLDVFEVATGRRVWYARRASVPRWIPEAFRSARPSGEWSYPRFADLRWSPDGRCLSFTTCDDLYDMSEASCSVTVLDVQEWRPVLNLPNASNAFVVTPPAAGIVERR